MDAARTRYVEVIVPLKFCGGIIHYSVPGIITEEIQAGSWVVVTVMGRRYLAVVRRAGCPLPEGLSPQKILPIEKVAPLRPLPPVQIEFWQMLADYYMCSIGEVFKSAYPSAFFRQTEKTRTVNKAQATAAATEEKTLSREQQQALEQTQAFFAAGKHTVLLSGVTSSGKTEIYIKLAQMYLEQGRSVLYLVPEIAMSRQLEQRLRSALGDKVLVFHSKQTFPTRKKVFDKLIAGDGNYLVLGTRSALFLPMVNLGFIIVDEEHDQSYKQTDPAPRYNGRDAALMMAARLGVNTLLGSATPSMESLYNVSAGKYGLVELNHKYYGAEDAPVTVIDMAKVYAMHNARGSFSMQLVNLIAARLKDGEQVMVFRSRRSYSSFLQCDSCGETLRCPRCNVSLTYHKYNNSVSCHYCGWHATFDPTCHKCGKGTFTAKGAGTERLAEELQELFPDARIARFDAETAATRTEEKKILGDFASGAIDILVGTQMITKGFDFENLALVAVISADSIFSLQDFRADEKALQLLTQLRGRVGRRSGTGQMVIQAFGTDHPVLAALKRDCSDYGRQMLDQRKLFGFPPYVRMIQLTVRTASPEELRRTCSLLSSDLKRAGVKDVSDPIVPAVDRIAGLYIRHIWIKLPRTTAAQTKKASIAAAVDRIRQLTPSSDIIIDVDPL
jgi:primosomal protein N' (replication factor Y)